MSELKGFILIDKPCGISSFEVIRRLRKHLGIRKIGHAGTLDPFASGLLICAVGSYTRLLQYVESQNKTYEVKMVLGIQTSTGDPEGVVINQTSCESMHINPDWLKQAVMQITRQQVPAYSAIKIRGKRAYQYARENTQIDLPHRDIRIFDFELLSMETKAEGQIELNYLATVSKGTYIRTLSEQIAGLLDTVGYTKELRRTQIGKVCLTEALSLDELPQGAEIFISARGVLADMPALELDQGTAKDILLGKSFAYPREDSAALVLYYPAETIVAIAEAQSGMIQPRIVLP
jgi:tRNA pseudouridine55 synthase